MADEILLAPELILTAFAVALPVVGLFISNKRIPAYLTLIALLAAAWLTFASLFPSDLLPWMPGVTASGPLVYGVYEFTPFAQAVKLIFLVVAFLVVLASPSYLGKDDGTRGHEGEYYGLLLFSTVGMMAIASARELVTLFLALELSSFATYILAGYRKKDPASAEASMKYFIVGALSSALIIYGISVIYAVTGTTDMVLLSRAFAGVPASVAFNPLLVLSTVLLLAGFGYKVAMVPYHLWAPDVYEGAPTPVSGFLASGAKKAGFAALFKILFIALIGLKANWDVAIAALAILTMTIGNLVALSQTSMKRMLAYSSIAQAGYILIAFAVGTTYAVAGGLFQMLTHALMTTGAFIVIAGLAVVGLGGKIEDFKGLGRRAPLVAFAMALFLISLAGLPPLAGFASKFVLFSSAVDVASQPGKDWLVWLAVAGVLNSAMSLFYYARVVRYMYVEETLDRTPLVLPRGVVASVFIAMLAIVIIGLYPNPVIELASRAAGSLLVFTP